MILHLTLPEDWAAARAAGVYTVSTRGAGIAEVGFLHASEDERQAGAVAAAFYADRPDAFLVALDEDALAAAGLEVRREPGNPADPQSELLPHVYGGPIPVALMRPLRPSLTLRPYAPDDAAATLDVFRAAVTGTAAAHYTPEQIRAWCPADVDADAWAARRAAAWTVVAVDGAGRVLGFADLTADGVLDMLFVHPEAGGRGASRLLVGAVLAEARRRGLPRVDVRASRSARPVLEALGFTVDGEDPGNTVRGVVVPNTRMHAGLAGSAGSPAPPGLGS